MKKILTVFLGLGLALGLLGCNLDSEKEFVDDEQLFTLQALSATSLMNYNETNIDEVSYLPLSEVTTEEDEPVINEEIDNIDRYVELMEAFLGNDNLTVTESESEREDFTYKLVYEVKNLDGTYESYIFYYSEFILEDPEEPLNEEQPEGKNNFRFQDEDDNLVVKGLTGILIYEDTEYNIEGKKVTNDNKEIYRLRSFIDEDNYVVVNYQSDIEDNSREKFFYKMVEDGITINESKVMIFEKNRMTHVKLEFSNETESSSFIFNIRTIDNVRYIMLNYEISEGEEIIESGNARIKAETDSETGEVIYTYQFTPNQFKGQFEHNYRHGNGHGRGNQA
ncbi:MAG: hypothetical protein WCY80_02755 [Candidatus Izemoplasmatales bacterium]